MLAYSLRRLVSSHNYLKVSPTDMIRNVACLMPAHHTSAALVVDLGGRLAGLITERDIVEKAVGIYRNVDRTTVGEIMKRDPITIDINQTHSDAMNMMTTHGLRTLPVLEDGLPAGIVDIRDLYKLVYDMLEQEIKSKNSLLSYCYGDSYSCSNEYTDDGNTWRSALRKSGE